MDEWQTDYRWRRLRVTAPLLSELFRGGGMQVSYTTAPPDLAVVNLSEVQTGPNGQYVFIVWSSTFEPIAHEGALLVDDIPEIQFEYSR